MPDHQLNFYPPDNTLTFYRKYMPPEALAPGVPLAVREAIRQYCRDDSEHRRPGNLKPQLLAVWATIRGELALFSAEGTCELPHARLAELSGVGVNQVGEYVSILVELGLLSIVGERQGTGACRPSPVYDINHLELLQRSDEMFLDACAWRGIKRLPKSRVNADQMTLFDDPSPPSDAEHGPSLGGDAFYHSDVVEPTLPGDGALSPSLPGDEPHHLSDIAAESDNSAAPPFPSETVHHSGGAGLSHGSDGQDPHAWTHESTDRSDDDGTPRSSGDLIAALREVLPEVLTDIIGTPHKNGAAPRAFAPPAPLDVPEPAPGRAALPAHPWRLWVAAATDGETEGNWNTLAWLANQHGWHWVGEAILQLANGVGIDSTKKIKVKLDWWRRNQNYGANNRRYEQMLAAEEAPAHPESMLVAVEQAADAAEEHDALTDTEQYLLDTGFAAMTAQEFRLFDLDAVEQEIERTLSAMDTNHERDQKIGRLVVKWRRQPPVAVAEEPEPDAPALAMGTDDELAEQPAPDDPEAIWDAAQAALRLSIAHGDYARWLRDVAILGLTDDMATLVCPDRGHADHVARHFDSQVRRALADVIGAPVSVQIVARM